MPNLGQTDLVLSLELSSADCTEAGSSCDTADIESCSTDGAWWCLVKVLEEGEGGFSDLNPSCSLIAAQWKPRLQHCGAEAVGKAAPDKKYRQCIISRTQFRAVASL